MKYNKSNESRRKLLKSIAAGSGAIVAGRSLPESWSRPVVDSVMLPVHAQTSGTISYFQMNAQQILVGSLIEEDSGHQDMLAEVMDSLVPDAIAQPGTGSETDWCVEVTGGVAKVTYVNNSGDAWWSGEMPTDGTPVNLPLVHDNCEPPRPAGGGELRIVGYTFGDPTITIRATGKVSAQWQVIVPIATDGCSALGLLTDICS